jgi:SAM-dependent methyltransferase
MRLAVLALVGSLLVCAQRPKSNSLPWDQIYLSPDGKVPVNPSALVLESTANLKPGAALDVGMGNGRNAIYLARKGWKVVGIDSSDAAIKQAQTGAAKLGAQIDARKVRFEDLQIAPAQYDLILCMYVNELPVKHAKKIAAALKPNGILIVEGYHSDAAFANLKPETPQVGYQTNELIKAFSALRILRYEDRSAQAEWANGPDGRAPLVRLVAKKY